MSKFKNKYLIELERSSQWDYSGNGILNLARIKFIVMFICVLCKVQTVGFGKSANAFDAKAKSASSLRRVQRYIVQFSLIRIWLPI